ncbi:MAG: Nif3-like dinuclear metal center hexameric protein [Caldilineaceae bacterium]|nr:Nif3-like dinuclear metal center hexameric protein [Caldilineaceae bacterium]
MQRDELVRYLDDTLRINEVADYGPQGLQIEGRPQVDKIVGLVDAHQPCVEAALDRSADLMLVHHGIFWGGAKPLVGSYGRLVRAFIEHDLNLYAAHLALDAHPQWGNNAELARRLGLTVTDWWANVKGTPLAVLAECEVPLPFDELVDRYRERVGMPRLVQAEGPAMVKKVGILSGFGADKIADAAGLGCDAYITGETSHSQYYEAVNAGINLLYGGHYTSETVGVQALGAHLAERFNVDFEFVDLPTGL